jgi:predicted phage terminase large subunit-like protein
MQRLNMNDPSGHWLEKQETNVRHICLPGEIQNFKEFVKPPELAKFYVDNLLDTKRISWKVLKDMESKLGQYGYAGQIGQNPTPPGGGMFKVDNIIITNEFPLRGQIEHSVRAWDKAGTVNGGDYTVGIKMMRLAGNRWFIADMVRGQWSSNERENVIRATAEKDGYETEIWMEQEMGSAGKESSEGTIRNLAGFRAFAERPTGDKAHRADPFSVQVNNGSVMMLNAGWGNTLLEELRYFPYATHDDCVDSLSLAFQHLIAKRIAHRIT